MCMIKLHDKFLILQKLNEFRDVQNTKTNSNDTEIEKIAVHVQYDKNINVQ